jgi:Kef-type K+ transport system membrane component KefB
MSGTILIGIIIIAGFIFGELVNKIKLPKVTGYIIVGIILSPDVTLFIPGSFVKHTDIVTNISLGIITFSVGHTAYFKDTKHGKTNHAYNVPGIQFGFKVESLN